MGKKLTPQEIDAIARQHRGLSFDEEPAAATASEGLTFEEPKPAAAQEPEPTFTGEIGKIATQTGKDVVALKDLLAGIGAGVFHTLGGATQLAQKAGTLGLFGPPQSPELQGYLKQAATPPQTPMGQAGYYGEQAAEFLLPGGAVERGVAALTKAPRVAQIAGRAALEGASAAGVAGLQTGGDPKAMRDAALMAGATTAAIGTAAAAAPAVATGLGRWATNQYGKVLNPTMRGTKYISRNETIPGMLERRVTAGSMEGMLNKAQAQVEKWGKAVEDAWNRVPQNTPLDAVPLIQAVDDSVAKASIGGVNLGPVADTMITHASQMKDVVMKLARTNPRTGTLELTVGDLRKLKKFSEDIAAEAGAYEGKTIADKSLTSTYETIADAARGQINTRFPHVEQANQQFSFWKNAEKVVDETIQRRVGQERGLIRNIGNTIGGALGTAVGNQIGGTEGMVIGGLVGTKTADLLQKAMTSTAWRTTSAVTKQRLADALNTGNIGAAEFYLRKILAPAAAAEKTVRLEPQTTSR